MVWRKLFLLLTVLWLAAAGQLAEAVPQDAFHSKYHLAQVIVLSRHNIRAPLTGSGTLAGITAHKWHDFGVGTGELTAHGAQIEEKMGAYCHLYFQKEDLFPADYQPGERDIRFYANAFQRTIATAESFETGMFPHVDVPVQYNGNVNDADPVFLPGQGGHKAPFDENLTEELAALGGSLALTQSVAAGIKTAAVVLDNPEVGTGEFQVNIQEGVHLGGSIRPLMTACDALTLQYYELGDSRAGFGHELSFNEWREIAAVKDLGIHTYRHLPTLSRALARPLLSIFQEELNLQRRKFTFLCGHDTNIATVMGAMEVKDTVLPETIEQEAPIGCKLVVEEWQDQEGESYVALKLVYPSTNQLCSKTPIDANNPPQVVPLHLQNIHPNADGLITMQDFQQRLTDAITSDAELMGIRY